MRIDDRRPRAVLWTAAAMLLAIALGHAPARAQPAPESMRLSRDGDAIVLTRESGAGPYGVYRQADDASRVVDTANDIGVTAQTAFRDPGSLQPAGDVLYDLVDESPR